MEEKVKQFIDDFKARHPEWDGADHNSFVAIVADELGNCLRREAAMTAMLEADPRAAQFLRNWTEGRDPVVELIRQFGPELREVIDDPSRQEALAEANSQYLERVAAEQRVNSEFEQNIAKSLEMVDQLSATRGLDDATLERAWDWLRHVTDDGIRGIVSAEALDMALRAISHDADVAEARRDGEVRGRNEAIDTHLKQFNAGDGTIAGARSGGGLRPATRTFGPLGVLDEFDRFRSVWE